MFKIMDRAELDGIEIEYDVRGAGEPVVLIHPGHFADWFAPLFDEPALSVERKSGPPAAGSSTMVLLAGPGTPHRATGAGCNR